MNRSDIIDNRMNTLICDIFSIKYVYLLVKDFQKYKGKGWVDEEMEWGVMVEEEKNDKNSI